MARFYPISSFLALLAAVLLLSAPAYAARDLGLELAYAATVDQPDVIAKLIKEGASPNALNSQGIPALSLAAQRTDRSAAAAVNALLDGGAKIDMPDAAGQTALFYAVRAANKDTVGALLKRGAQYYLPDKSGNIPRNYAFKEGKKEIAEQIDNFVKGKTSEVMAKYEAQNQATRAAVEAATATVKKKSEEKKPEPLKPLDSDMLGKTVRDLSFHTCAQAYWNFCRSASMRTQFSPRDLTVQIDAHARLVADTKNTLLTQFRAKPKYINKITQPSQKEVVAQLNAYVTNVERSSKGVGKVADMEERCTLISEQWQLVQRDNAPRTLRPVPAATSEEEEDVNEDTGFKATP